MWTIRQKDGEPLGRFRSPEDAVAAFSINKNLTGIVEEIKKRTNDER